MHNADRTYPAVFLDRDGTINEEMGYINHPSRFRLLPNVAGAIKRLNEAGFKVIVVTNQSGVARGYFTESLLEQVVGRMKTLLARKGAYIDKFYYCPHHPDAIVPEYQKDCPCRKPKTGMVDKAVSDFSIDVNRSYCVGDRIKDVYFGHQAGLTSILVLTGYGRGEYEYQRRSWKEQPDYIAPDLYNAVEWILDDSTLKDEKTEK